MEINVSAIKNHLGAAYEFVAEKIGVLAHHTVKVLKIAAGHIRQDVRLEAATFVVGNIVFLHTAAKVLELINYLLPTFENYERLKTAKNLVLLGCFTGLIVGMNAVLAKGVQTKLSTKAIALISTATCLCYISVRLMIASRNNGEVKKPAVEAKKMIV